MALGDLIVDLSTIGTFESGEVGGEYPIAVSNDGKYVARSYGTSSEVKLVVYDVESGTEVYNSAIGSITVSSLNIVGSTENEVLLLGFADGVIKEETIANIVAGTFNPTEYTISSGNGINGLVDNGLDYSDENCRIGVQVSISGGDKAFLIDPADYTTNINSIDFSTNGEFIDAIDMKYDAVALESTLVVSGGTSDNSQFFVEGIKENATSIARVVIGTADLVNLSMIYTINDFRIYEDSATGNLYAKCLVQGEDASASLNTEITITDLTNTAVVSTRSIVTGGVAFNFDIIYPGDSDPNTVYPLSNTEVVEDYGAATSTIITTTNDGLPIVSPNNEVIVVEEVIDPMSLGAMDGTRETTSVKVYEGYVSESGPSLSFPTEENIYFFDNTDTLINSINVGQLSPLKDTDIYKVKMATNVTTDTFESITLGTTENSVDCLLSSTEDPFEGLEQITIPFTNSDVVEVFFKLSTDEVQTVGDASLELLVVGNLAS